MRRKYSLSSLSTCPECGAAAVKNKRCWEQLGALLAWEWHDTSLYAEHFLTVTAYNLQHPARFTDEAIEELSEVFIEHLDHELPTTLLRRRMAQRFARSRKVIKDKAARQVHLRLWRMTIADVYLPDHPECAAERVRMWARSIRDEL